MKRLLLAALLCCAFSASAQDYLKTFRNKTSKQIANVTHLQRRDTTFYHLRIGDFHRDQAAATEARGLTPLDFATIKSALDTSIFRKNRLIFPPGTFTVDSLGIYSPITLSGVGIKRIKTTDTDYYGSILKTSNTTGLPFIKVRESGVYLHDISLQGTKTNGHGYNSQRVAVSGSINTTLGGYGLSRVNSFNHGGSGFYIVGSDGNLFDEIESFDNRGYGVVAISPAEAGLTSAGATAAGTTSLFRGGRSRSNKLGGWLISDQAAVGLHHIEAIGDTSIGVWFKAGRSRNYVRAADVEMQIPALTSTPLTTGMRVEDMNGFLMEQSFIGTQHDISTTYTADAGTNTTTIVDAALVNYGPDGYFIGWDVVNSTRSSGEVRITGYTASTGTLTLTSAIASQTTGDSFTLSKDQNVGLRLHNLTSGVFMNNTFGSNVDTMIATVGNGAGIFINNINFDPADNIKTISGTFKYLGLNLSTVDSLSGQNARWTSNAEVHHTSTDSIIIKSTGSAKGIEIDATAGKVAIQPTAEGGVHLFGQVGDDENPDFRIYYDADTTAVTVSTKYYDFAGSLTQPNIFSVQNVDSTQTLSFGTPVRFSGSTSERYFDIQHHQAGTHGGTPSNGFVRFWSRGDTAFVTDDNGTERSLFAAGAAGDIEGVTAGDGLSGGGTSGTVTLNFNPKLVSQTLEVVSDSVRVKAASIGANELASTAVTPGSYTAADITVDADGRITAAASGAGGSGDITSVGDVASGAAFDGTQGTTLTFNNAGGDATQAYDGSVIAFSHPLTVQASDPADAEAIRLDNAEGIAWEASPAGTDVTLKVDASEILQASGAFNAGGAITEATNAVPNATDHLGFFAATTSSQFAGVVSDETGSGALVLGTSPTITTSLSQDGDVADAGYLRLQNAANIAWEASPAGTDVTLGVDASEILQASGAFNSGGAITEATNAVPNATDHLGFFAATTSSQFAGVVSDETGTGAVVLAVSPSHTGAPGASFSNGATSAGSIRILEDTDDGSNYTDITVPALAANITYTLPPDDGDAGEQLQTNGSGVLTWESAGSSSFSFSPATTHWNFEDWVSGAANTSGAMGRDWQRTIATSGTTTHQTGESGRPGIMRFFCANSAGSTAALHTDVASYLVNSAYVLTASVRFSSLGTAATNGAYYRVGFMDDVGATIPTDGAWIEFNVDSSATRWRAVTGNGGTRKITTDGVLTVATNTWYKLTITPNSGGTSIVFAVDGTTIATHTEHIPTGGVGVAMVAAAVTASATKYMEQDYIQILNTGLSR